MGGENVALRRHTFDVGKVGSHCEMKVSQMRRRSDVVNRTVLQMRVNRSVNVAGAVAALVAALEMRGNWECTRLSMLMTQQPDSRWGSAAVMSIWCLV